MGLFINTDHTFEILSEEKENEEEIDIQEIKPLGLDLDVINEDKLDIKSKTSIAVKINVILQAVKQLDKRISNNNIQNNDNTLNREFAKGFPATVLLKSNVPSEIEKHIPMM